MNKPSTIDYDTGYSRYIVNSDIDVHFIASMPSPYLYEYPLTDKTRSFSAWRIITWNRGDILHDILVIGPVNTMPVTVISLE